MAISKFDKQLQIEQLRYIEAEHPLEGDGESECLDHSENEDFDHRLWQRAMCLIKQHDFWIHAQRACNGNTLLLATG